MSLGNLNPKDYRELNELVSKVSSILLANQTRLCIDVMERFMEFEAKVDNIKCAWWEEDGFKRGVPVKEKEKEINEA